MIRPQRIVVSASGGAPLRQISEFVDVDAVLLDAIHAVEARHVDPNRQFVPCPPVRLRRCESMFIFGR